MCQNKLVFLAGLLLRESPVDEESEKVVRALVEWGSHRFPFAAIEHCKKVSLGILERSDF